MNPDKYNKCHASNQQHNAIAVIAICLPWFDSCVTRYILSSGRGQVITTFKCLCYSNHGNTKTTLGSF